MLRMNRASWFLYIVILFSACQADTKPQAESPNQGKVVAIADGDTFTLLGPDKKQERVRLYGIDCPEKNQPFGQVARKRLSALVFGKPVRLESRGRDRYKRVLALVWVNDTVLVNTQLLREGLAWHYDRYDDDPQWEALEQQARSSKVGLWSEPAPVEPWNWRKSGN
jgi:micrococcal nuclease